MSTSAPPPSRGLPGPGKLIAAGAVLAAAVAAAFILLSSSSSPVGDPIARAAATTSSTPGYRMKFTMNISSPALPSPITGSGSGSVDSRDHAASMSFAIDVSQIPQVSQELGNAPLRFDVLLDKTVLYMKLPSALTKSSSSLGGKPWLKVDVAKASGIPGLSSLFNNPVSSNPSQTLDYLRAASSGVQNEGQQQVDGIQTTHYRAQLSLNRVAANVPASQRAAFRKVLSKLHQTTGLSTLPVDVWIDGQNLVRRMAMSLSLHTASVPLHEDIDVHVSNYGPQPQPTAPPADQVSDLTALAAGG